MSDYCFSGKRRKHFLRWLRKLQSQRLTRRQLWSPTWRSVNQSISKLTKKLTQPFSIVQSAKRARGIVDQQSKNVEAMIFKLRKAKKHFKMDAQPAVQKVLMKLKHTPTEDQMKLVRAALKKSRSELDGLKGQHKLWFRENNAHEKGVYLTTGETWSNEKTLALDGIRDIEVQQPKDHDVFFTGKSLSVMWRCKSRLSGEFARCLQDMEVVLVDKCAKPQKVVTLTASTQNDPRRLKDDDGVREEFRWIVPATFESSESEAISDGITDGCYFVSVRLNPFADTQKEGAGPASGGFHIVSQDI
jgi:hypothetical protein